MLRGRLGLLVASLMPVCVLIGGFIASNSTALLHPFDENDPYRETASSDECGEAYRDWFGAETPYSDGYCPGQNIWKTMENAWFESTGDNEQYRWRRDQEWYFDNPPTPIPGNYCYITLNRPGETYSLNGLWTGVEIKERIGNRVKLQTNWLRWECDFINGFYYRCPYQRQYDGWDEPLYFDCERGNTSMKMAKW